jgi:hypothetical protein
MTCRWYSLQTARVPRKRPRPDYVSRAVRQICHGSLPHLDFRLDFRILTSAAAGGRLARIGVYVRGFQLPLFKTLAACTLPRESARRRIRENT